MHRLLLGMLVAVGSLAACTVSSTEGGGGTPSPSPSPSPSSPSPSPSPSSGATSSGSGGRPVASTLEAPVAIDGTCPAFDACGGSPIGTYDYASGCIDDVFADLRQQCPTVDTSKLTVTAKGSIYLDGKTLGREITVDMAGDITLPASCTFGACAMVESSLKGAFDSVSCTGTSSCTCKVSRTDTNASGTNYTIDGSTLTTADGDTYSICESGADLTYRGKSAGSEEGTFTLKRR